VGKREIKESLATKIYDADAQALFLRKLDAALRMLRVAEVQLKSADMQKAEAIMDESFRIQVEELGEDQDRFYESTLELLALFERQSWRLDLELELPGSRPACNFDQETKRDVKQLIGDWETPTSPEFATAECQRIIMLEAVPELRHEPGRRAVERMLKSDRVDLLHPLIEIFIFLHPNCEELRSSDQYPQTLANCALALVKRLAAWRAPDEDQAPHSLMNDFPNPMAVLEAPASEESSQPAPEFKAPKQATKPKIAGSLVDGRVNPERLDLKLLCVHRIEQMKPAAKTASDWQGAVTRFEKLHGQLPIESITRNHIIEYRDMLAKLPRQPAQSIARLPIDEQIAEVQKSGLPTLHWRTINKYLDAIRGLLRHADTEFRFENNAAAQVKNLAPMKSDAPARAPYSMADIKTILTSPAFVGCRDAKNRSEAGVRVIRDALFWLPQLALWTGARLEELGELTANDIRQDFDIWVIDINSQGNDKFLKNASSARIVPIHSRLIERGFIGWVDKQREKGGRFIFDDLKTDRDGRRTKYFSRQWREYCEQVGIADKRKVFHSFRHSFVTACEAVGMEDKYI
jgi:integrase